MFAQNCENKFCIYWEDHSCILDSISLDVQGNCQNCIYVDLDETMLSDARKELRKTLDRAFYRK